MFPNECPRANRGEFSGENLNAKRIRRPKLVPGRDFAYMLSHVCVCEFQARKLV